MAKRTYVTETKAPVPVEEREADFELSGIGQVTGVPWSEEFYLLPIAPVGCVDDLLSSMQVTPDGKITYRQVPLMRFFRGVLEPGNLDRWEALTHDPDRAVDLKTLGEIMRDLSLEMLGIPIGPPPSSAVGRRRTNGTSAGVSSGTASKPKPRPRTAKRPASSGG